MGTSFTCDHRPTTRFRRLRVDQLSGQPDADAGSGNIPSLALAALQSERPRMSLKRETAAGLVLVGSNFQPIYANAEARQILAYPDGFTPNEAGFLSDRIRSLLLTNGNGSPPVLASEFTSGRRRYLCRAFCLSSSPDDSLNHPAMALLFERSRPTSFAVVAAQFHLTRREQQTLQYLAQGSTNKEIARQMNISPNTVKAFVKLMMMKMGASTRSALIGSVLNLRSEKPTL